MEAEFLTLLSETKEALAGEGEKDQDDLHSKVLGLYTYLDAGTVRDAALIDEYNAIVEECRALGLRRIRRYAVKKQAAEHEEGRRREQTASSEEAEKLGRAILEHSRTLKKKSEAFGTMLDLSKGLLDTVTAGVRKNVHHVEKGLETLEKKEWYAFGTRQTIGLVLLVVLVFCAMYCFIRLS